MVKRVFIVSFLAVCILLSSDNFVMSLTVKAVESQTPVPLNLYVATTGDDSAEGSIQNPLRTVAKVQELINQMEEIPNGGVVVNIREGIYNTFKSINIQTKATKDNPVIYRAYGNETVTFDGTIPLNVNDFNKVTDEKILARIDDSVRDNVYVYDLSSKNITIDPIQKIGFGWESPPYTPIELNIDGRSQTLARWPNGNDFTTTGEIITQGFIPRNHEPDACTNPADHPPREEWINQPGPKFGVTIDNGRYNKWLQENDSWVSGYWVHDWAIDNMSIKEVTTSNNKYYLEAGQPSRYGARSGKRFYAFNLLCEIDTEGEWYINRETSKMYIYPEGGTLEGKELTLKMNKEPFFSIENAEYVKIENIDFKNSRGDGIVINNSNNVEISGCTFTELNNRAVVINGGSNCGVVSCDISRMGQGGIYLNGGDRVNLINGNHYAINNEIWDYQRVIRTYTPAIDLKGCGLIAKNNVIHDAPHLAIHFIGNEMLIENNEIYRVCLETDDCGAIYTLRNWTFRGNVINNNYLHDIGKPTGAYGSAGVYLDDVFSSATVTNNLFVKSGKYAILIGGGRDNIFKNNITINTPVNIHCDARGVRWTNGATQAPNGSIYMNFMETYNLIKDNAEAKAIWDEKYPLLAGAKPSGSYINDKDGLRMCYPKGNKLKDNIAFGVSNNLDIQSEVYTHSTVDNNITFSNINDIGFENISNQNYIIKDKSKILEKIPDFVGIDITKVGLFLDKYRTTIGTTLGDFQLTAPLDKSENIDFLNLNLNWTESENAKSYSVVFSQKSDFSVIDATCTTSNSSCRAPVLKADTTYYWKVIALEGVANGNKRESQIFSFTTKQKEYSIFESFENGLDYWTIEDGTPITTSELAHDSLKSLKINGDRTILSRRLSEEEYGTVEIWMYDNGSNNIATVANVSPVGEWCAVGIHSGKGNNYVLLPDWAPTNVARTKGWHKLKWDYTSGRECIISIDDIEVSRQSTSRGFEYIGIGDYWKTGISPGNTLFDDLKIEIQTPNTPPTDIILSESDITLKSGESYQLNAYVLPVRADQTVVWNTSDYNIASVSQNGLVTAGGAGPSSCGTVEVTASTKDGTFTKVCTVTVLSDNKYRLNQLIEQAEEKCISPIYLEISKKAYAAMLDDAKKVYEDNNATDNEIQLMIESLETYGEQLIKVRDLIFKETFEGIDLSKWITNFDTQNNYMPVTIENITSLQNHGIGTNSLLIKKDTMKHKLSLDIAYLPEHTSPKITFWIYDENPVINTPNAYAITITNVAFDNVLKTYMGIDTRNNANYVKSAWEESTVARTNGWHKFVYDTSEKGNLKCYIDDVLVNTYSISDTTIKSLFIGSDWATIGLPNNVYYDDISIEANRTEYNIEKWEEALQLGKSIINRCSPEDLQKLNNKITEVRNLAFNKFLTQKKLDDKSNELKTFIERLSYSE